MAKRGQKTGKHPHFIGSQVCEQLGADRLIPEKRAHPDPPAALPQFGSHAGGGECHGTSSTKPSNNLCPAKQTDNSWSESYGRLTWSWQHTVISSERQVLWAEQNEAELNRNIEAIRQAYGLGEPEKPDNPLIQ